LLNAIADLPPGVIGFEVAGKLRAEDYRDILLPAVQEATRAGEVRVLIVIPSFDGVTGGALWADLKMGVKEWGAWKRIALVSDIEWMARGVEWFGWMTPGEVKHFPLAQRDAAVTWVAG
jgi:hypothetical protein